IPRINAWIIRVRERVEGSACSGPVLRELLDGLRLYGFLRPLPQPAVLRVGPRPRDRRRSRPAPATGALRLQPSCRAIGPSGAHRDVPPAEGRRTLRGGRRWAGRIRLGSRCSMRPSGRGFLWLAGSTAVFLLLTRPEWLGWSTDAGSGSGAGSDRTLRCQG